MVRYLKRLKSSRLGRVQAFPMYGGLGMSAPSLHRESTDSLIESLSDNYIYLHVYDDLNAQSNNIHSIWAKHRYYTLQEFAEYSIYGPSNISCNRVSHSDPVII